MSEPFAALQGMAAAYDPVDDPDPVPGTVVEIRDDHPDPSQEAIRVVLDTEAGPVDVAKYRVEVL